MQRSIKVSWRKLLVLAMGLALALAALYGCGDGEQQGDPQTENNLGAGTAWQSVADVDGLTLIMDEKSGDTRVQVPAFVNEDGDPGLDALNKRLQERAEHWQSWLADEANEGSWIEVRPLVIDTDGYLSVVLYEAEWPNYGTDGEASAYVWDKVTKSAMDEELAWSLAGASDETVAAALTAYVENVLNDADREYRWREFTTVGYYADTDGKAALVLQVRATLEGGDDWNYLLVYKDGQITGNLSYDVNEL